jgi:streptogramin lyase
MRPKFIESSRIALVLSAALLVANLHATAADLAGTVQGAGQPITGSTVTLYAAGTGRPTQLAQGKSDGSGAFRLTYGNAPADSILYVVAKGGTPKAAAGKGASEDLALLAVLGGIPPKRVTVNELTTVASAFTAARFINGESISGPGLGLRVAAGNVTNFVDLATGEWGEVVLNPLNSAHTTTLATLDTLGSLVSAYFTVADDAWRARFLNAATPPSGVLPKNTLEAIAGIARVPWANPKELYALFDEAYPQPKNPLERRKATFAPYLAYPPPDFALALYFNGGGLSGPGKFVFDAEGNLWSGQNFLPGSQSGTAHNIGGGLAKFAPNGKALSPAINGFRGMGVDGIAWGTGVTLDKVWVSTFNGLIGVFDLSGRAAGVESDIPVAGKIGGMQGVGVGRNGDIWIADATKDQMVYFPGGRMKDGRIVSVPGLKSPFGVAVDNQNRVWVSNAQSNDVVRFPAEDPSKAESFNVGIAARGIALDSKGNLWVSSMMALDFPPLSLPPGTPINTQFQLLGQHMFKLLTTTVPFTGAMNMIRPDGTQPAPKGFTGKAVNVPWGVSVDGNDDVWYANFWGQNIVLMAGADAQGYPAGTKAGDIIHVFKYGSMQKFTDAAVDPAGNVWAANNWNNLEAIFSPDPEFATSTQGAGEGFTVIYGVAAPVKTPLMGQVRKP